MHNIYIYMYYFLIRCCRFMFGERAANYLGAYSLHYIYIYTYT